MAGAHASPGPMVLVDALGRYRPLGRTTLSTGVDLMAHSAEISHEPRIPLSDRLPTLIGGGSSHLPALILTWEIPITHGPNRARRDHTADRDMCTKGHCIEAVATR